MSIEPKFQSSPFEYVFFFKGLRFSFLLRIMISISRVQKVLHASLPFRSRVPSGLFPSQRRGLVSRPLSSLGVSLINLIFCVCFLLLFSFHSVLVPVMDFTLQNVRSPGMILLGNIHLPFRYRCLVLRLPGPKLISLLVIELLFAPSHTKVLSPLLSYPWIQSSQLAPILALARWILANITSQQSALWAAA